MRFYATILFILTALVVNLNGKSLELNEENWRRILNGEWMVQFVAPWCTSCKSIAPIWERFAKNIDKYDVQVAKVDVTKSPALSGRFFVNILPTIYHVIDGKFRYYDGKRDNEALIEFIKQKQWKNIEPISSWTEPNSFHMGILSYFFRLSNTLKEWNTLLQDVYGLSPYGSYGLFVLGTILICGISTLMMFFMLDLVWPSKKNKKRHQYKDLKGSGIVDKVKKTNLTTVNANNDESPVEAEQIIEFKSDEDDSENEKKDEGIDDDVSDIDDDGANDNEEDDDMMNTTFVMSKDIELVPDMYEDDSDEDIYHNCKLILPVPSDSPEGFRKRADVSI